jgi:hypothetical protein
MVVLDQPEQCCFAVSTTRGDEIVEIPKDFEDLPLCKTTTSLPPSSCETEISKSCHQWTFICTGTNLQTIELRLLAFGLLQNGINTRPGLRMLLKLL